MMPKSRFIAVEWMVLLVLAVIALVAVEGRIAFNLVDARAYETGIRTWLAGGDPYIFTKAMNFLYPPAVLMLAGVVARAISLPVVVAIYLAIHFGASLLLPWVLYRYYLGGSTWSLPGFYLFFLLAPGLLGLMAVDCGNVAVICYTVMLTAGVRGITKNQWLLFYLAVFCCASIKFTFLPMLLMPLFCGCKQFLNAGACAAAILAGLGAQLMFLPDLFTRFRELLSRQSEDLGDVGKGFFGIIFHICHKLRMGSPAIPLVGYGIGASLAIAALILLKRRRVDCRFSAWPAVVVLGIFFVLPRVNYYDLCVAFPLAFCLSTERMLRIRASLIYVALFVPSYIITVRYRDAALNGGFETLVVFGMLCLVIYHLATARTAAMGIWNSERQQVASLSVQ